MRKQSQAGWARVAVAVGSVLGLIVLSGLVAAPALANLAPGLYLNAVKASPAQTYGQKFMDVFPNGTGESVRISVAPVVDGVSVTVNDSSNASGPCTPDGAPWTWTCTMSQPQALGVWFLRFYATTSVPEGTSVTSTFTDDVAGWTTSEPVTFKRQAYNQPTAFFDTDPTTGAHQLTVSLLNNGAQDATSSSITMSGLAGILIPSLPSGCQRSGDTISCDTGPLTRNVQTRVPFPVITSLPWFDVTVSGTALPNGWGVVPTPITYHFALPTPSPAGPPAPPSSPVPPVQPGATNVAGSSGAGGSLGHGGADSGAAVGGPVGSGGGTAGGPAGTAAGDSGSGASAGVPMDASSSPAAGGDLVAAPAQALGGNGLPLVLIGLVVVSAAGIVTAMGLRRRRARLETPAG